MTLIYLVIVLGVVLIAKPQTPNSTRVDAPGTGDGVGSSHHTLSQRLDPYPLEKQTRRLDDKPLHLQQFSNEASVGHGTLDEVPPVINTSAALARLSEALRFRTISWDGDISPDSSAFYALHDHLEDSFPLVQANLRRDTISKLSLLYTWPGSDSTLLPVLFLAHQDVVPAEDGRDWTNAPFSGTVADGYIWGRGTLDNKQGVMAMLEAVEQLISDGFAPERTIYLAFGHDEEIGGHMGARMIAAHLETRGVRLAAVIDEGGIVLSDFLPDARRPVAAIGIAEKGQVTLELRVEVQGGHASVPLDRSAIGTLSRAVGRLERRPFRARIRGVTGETLRALAPTQRPVRRLMMSNTWLFRPLVVNALSRRPETDAMIRTTIAPTTISAGGKRNVLPTSAQATINVRTMPGETVESVVAHVRRAIDDPAVDIRIIGTTRLASRLSPTSTRVYETLSGVVRAIHPGDDVLIVPYLVPGGTDSRHFAHIAETTYRFTAIQLSREEAARFHGVNERLPVREYDRLIKAYYRLIRGLQKN